MKTKKTLLAAALGAAILTAGPPAVAQEMTFFGSHLVVPAELITQWLDF